MCMEMLHALYVMFFFYQHTVVMLSLSTLSDENQKETRERQETSKDVEEKKEFETQRVRGWSFFSLGFWIQTKFLSFKRQHVD